MTFQGLLRHAPNSIHHTYVNVVLPYILALRCLHTRKPVTSVYTACTRAIAKQTSIDNINSSVLFGYSTKLACRFRGDWFGSANSTLADGIRNFDTFLELLPPSSGCSTNKSFSSLQSSHSLSCCSWSHSGTKWTCLRGPTQHCLSEVRRHPSMFFSLVLLTIGSFGPS